MCYLIIIVEFMERREKRTLFGLINHVFLPPVDSVWSCLGLLWDHRLDVWTEQLHQFLSRFTEMAAKMVWISSSRELSPLSSWLDWPFWPLRCLKHHMRNRQVERARGTTKVSEGLRLKEVWSMWAKNICSCPILLFKWGRFGWTRPRTTDYWSVKVNPVGLSEFWCYQS